MAVEKWNETGKIREEDNGWLADSRAHHTCFVVTSARQHLVMRHFPGPNLQALPLKPNSTHGIDVQSTQLFGPTLETCAGISKATS